MSQAQNPRDNQALLQSMLQRLKLQAGAANLQNPAQETSDVQAVKDISNSVNGFEPERDIKRDFTVNGKTEDSSGTSGQNKDFLSQAGRPLSPNSVQDAKSVSSEGGFNFSSFQSIKDTSKGLDIEKSAEQNHGYVPKVYAWSPKSPDVQENKVFFEGAFGATQTVSSNQSTGNIRKQRPTENKTRRWTQKIKDKWRDRPGSFGKKDKYNVSLEKISQEDSSKYLPITTTNVISPSNEESGDKSVNSTDHSQTVSQTSDQTVSQTSEGSDEYMRSSNDFDLGLGSFSLLDEITIGQEWAKFLNPSISTSDHERPTPETPILTNHHDKCAGMNSVSQESGNNSWTLGTNGGTRDSDIAMTQALPETSLVGMDITEKYQIHSEPMEQGQSQSEMQVTVSEPQPCPPSTKTQPVNTVESSSLRGRNSLSRKRQYQPPPRLETMFQQVLPNGNDGADDGSVFLPENHSMENTEETSMNVSSTPTPCSPVRGVLKTTLSCDSTNSMETVSKKRRVEDTRRVRFSEEIITIDPPELGPYDSESEEEEEDEEDSLLEEDSEDTAEPALFAMQAEQAAPARRPVLPAWIRALKRRNTGKKHR